ncbi:response regulator transcription factor [Alteromonas sp. C1M14]|uniref:response regulator transcription factor n=1 Tax=Alteromonas sp. C1M14 TaxID=2841567 RepID=UPI001C0959EE|nr:response regulator transcription factor [Alteromonas sp. C1M14]MBU2977852.1 response regulator transcription factor [Alteromonas sp. C1M14]
MVSARILIIEDDRTLNDQMSSLLRKRGFLITQKLNGEEGLHTALTQCFDLILLDVLLPGKNGLAVLNNIRNVRSTPVMMITACDAEQERIEGFRKGADDYLPKPFNFTEMILRIDALLRRSIHFTKQNNTPSQITLPALSLDRIKQQAQYLDSNIELTPIQFKLLWVLAENQHEILSKAFLYQCVLGRPFSRYDRSLDMHISRVRKKLVDAGMPSERLSTLHGKGYQFV